eukprot:Transcript_1425.p5 GENE.Transcript_1425~~Transcript_1425.p5  ORF type:complete len:269 (-),score=89.39 Transcript_1425:792-1598(-)
MHKRPVEPPSASGHAAKRLRACVDSTTAVGLTALGTAKETDARKLEQRQKQIGYGKNSIAYQNYVREVPKYERSFDLINTTHPRTPDIQQDCSKRQFDGQIKAWRRQLHLWDTPGGEGADASVAQAAVTKPAADPPPLSSGFDAFLGIDEEEDDVDMPAAQAGAAEEQGSGGGGLFESGLLEDDDVPHEFYDEESTSAKPVARPPQPTQPKHTRPALQASPQTQSAPAAAPGGSLRSRLDAFKAKPAAAAPKPELSIYDEFREENEGL